MVRALDLIHYKLLVSAWNLIARVWEGKLKGQGSPLPFSSGQLPLLTWILCPILRVTVWFWALGFFSVLCTLFLLEICSVFYILWHPVSSVLRSAPFRKESSYSGAAVAQMKCCEECLHCVLMKWNYFVLFKKQASKWKSKPPDPVFKPEKIMLQTFRPKSNGRSYCCLTGCNCLQLVKLLIIYLHSDLCLLGWREFFYLQVHLFGYSFLISVVAVKKFWDNPAVQETCLRYRTLFW